MNKPVVTTTIGDEPFKKVDIEYTQPKKVLTIEELTEELILLKEFVNNNIINSVNQNINNINVVHERLLILENKNG